jgi:hypothetical protein
MAQPEQLEEEVRKQFKALGQDAKNHLVRLLIADPFVEGKPDVTLINMGRQHLARQILENSRELSEVKILKNIEDE